MLIIPQKLHQKKVNVYSFYYQYHHPAKVRVRECVRVQGLPFYSISVCVCVQERGGEKGSALGEMRYAMC